MHDYKYITQKYKTIILTLQMSLHVATRQHFLYSCCNENIINIACSHLEMSMIFTFKECIRTIYIYANMFLFDIYSLAYRLTYYSHTSVVLLNTEPVGETRIMSAYCAAQHKRCTFSKVTHCDVFYPRTWLLSNRSKDKT